MALCHCWALVQKRRASRCPLLSSHYSAAQPAQIAVRPLCARLRARPSPARGCRLFKGMFLSQASVSTWRLVTLPGTTNRSGHGSNNVFKILKFITPVVPLARAPLLPRINSPPSPNLPRRFCWMTWPRSPVGDLPTPDSLHLQVQVAESWSVLRVLPWPRDLPRGLPDGEANDGEGSVHHPPTLFALPYLLAIRVLSFVSSLTTPSRRRPRASPLSRRTYIFRCRPERLYMLSQL